MSRRVTPKGSGGDPDDLPTLRERNPMVWWVAVLMVVALIVGTIGSGLLIILV